MNQYSRSIHKPKVALPLLALVLSLVIPQHLFAQKRDTTKAAPRTHMNPFLQVGKDSAEIERLQETKEAQEKRDHPQKKDSIIKTQSATINAPTNYFIGEDKYLKVRKDDRKYDTFQVYDINHLDKKHAVVGLMTNTLKRGTRYEDKGAIERKVEISSGFVDKLDDNGKLIPGVKVAISSIKFNDKIFVIIGENDYRYLDGKRIVGTQAMVKELLQGKPITELTFYYELQKAGVLEPSMTYKQFSALKLEQKFDILNPYAKE